MTTAVYDGRQDDTDAIQEAIDGTAAAGGGTVYLAAATYGAATLTLKGGVEVRGAGRKATVLEAPEGQPAIVVPHGVRDWSVSNLTIKGGTHAIDMRGENPHWTLSNLYLVSQTSHGIQTDAVEDFTIRHVFIHGAGGCGWRGGVRRNGNGRTERGVIEGLRVDRCTLEGVHLADTAAEQWVRAVSFVQPTFILTGRHGLRAAWVSGLSIESASAENCGTATDDTYDAIHITEGNNYGVEVSACDLNFSSAHANAQRYGANIAATASRLYGFTKGRTDGHKASAGVEVSVYP